MAGSCQGRPARSWREASALLDEAGDRVDLVLLDVHFDIPPSELLGWRARRSGDTRLPTSLPQQPSSSSRYDDYDYDFEPIYPNTMPNTMGEIPTLYPTRSLPSEAAIPDYTPQLPKPPSFEPLINGRVLMALLGLFVLFGAAYFAAQFIFSILS